MAKQTVEPELAMHEENKIVLTEEKFAEFVSLLERPINDLPLLKATMSRKAPWA